MTLPARSSPADLGQPRRPPDLRLVPAALAVWAVVLIGIGLGPSAGVVVLIGCVLLVGVTVARHRGAAGAGVIIAASGSAAAAALVVTAHTLLVAQHPLLGPAERGAAAALRVVVADDPRPLRGPGYAARPGEAGQVLVPAALRRADVGAEGWAVGGRVLLIAPAEEWATLLPGQVATAHGLLAPAGRRDLTVAVLRVRGPPGEVSAPPWWQHAAGGLRAGLRHAADVLPPAPAGLLPGLAVGDTSRLTAEVEADFRAAGLTHLSVRSTHGHRNDHHSSAPSGHLRADLRGSRRPGARCGTPGDRLSGAL